MLKKDKIKLSNQLWACYFDELKLDKSIYLFLIIDVFSCFILSLRIFDSKRSKLYKQQFITTLAQYGMPESAAIDKKNKFWVDSEVKFSMVESEVQIVKNTQSNIIYLDENVTDLISEIIHKNKYISIKNNTLVCNDKKIIDRVETFNYKENPVDSKAPCDLYKYSKRKISPEIMNYFMGSETIKRVTKDGYIHHNGRIFTVSPEYEGKRVWLVEKDNKVVIECLQGRIGEFEL